MQNFNLLRELGQVRKPILLKRGIAATIEELLLSSEYILSGGNYDVILCERGIRTYETATRNTMDISAIPVVKKLSHLPVVGRSFARHRAARHGSGDGEGRGGCGRRCGCSWRFIPTPTRRFLTRRRRCISISLKSWLGSCA